MNPLTNVKNIQKLNERELQLGIIGKKSWHDEYKESAWIFTGGLPYDLTEGDIICVFSQYGEIVNLNLIRDHKTGRSKGFGFLCYEDQRSTVLAVDNLNGIKILGRTIRVDHVKDYKIPKEHGDEDEDTIKMRSEGCAPKLLLSSDDEVDQEDIKTEEKQIKKEKNKRRRKKKRRTASSSNSSSDSDEESKKGNSSVAIKQERFDDQVRGSFSASSDRQKREDGHRSEGSNSRFDMRNNSQRSGRELQKRDSDSESSRERERIHVRGYRSETNGSYSKNAFNSVSVPSDEYRGRDSNRHRDREIEEERGYSLERDREYNYYRGRERQLNEEMSNDFRRERGREYVSYGGRVGQRYDGRNNDFRSERERDQSWDRQGGKERYKREGGYNNKDYGRREGRERGRDRDRSRDSRS